MLNLLGLWVMWKDRVTVNLKTMKVGCNKPMFFEQVPFCLGMLNFRYITIFLAHSSNYYNMFGNSHTNIHLKNRLIELRSPLKMI